MRNPRTSSFLLPLLLSSLVGACGDGRPGKGIDDAIGEGSGGTAGYPGAAGAGNQAGSHVGLGELALADCEPLDESHYRADAQGLFDYPHVPTFDFFLPDDVWQHLQDTARDEQYAEAQLCFDGKLVGTVGLRFKGYYGSLFGCFDDQGELTCPRLSMKVKFDKYIDDQRFFGLKRLNFNAYYHDDSRIKEKLSYDLYRAMGIVAPRSAWAVLRVNGESKGVYGMVEQVDGRFTADRWSDNPDGNLYKEVWPTLEDADGVLEGLKTNEDVADVSAYVAFSQALDAADDDEFRSVLGEYMDPDYLARYFAVDDAIASYDGISYFWTDGVYKDNHNFYIYEEEPNSFILIPWDIDSSFWINPEHAAPHWTEIPDDCSDTYPYWDGLGAAPACDRFIWAMAQDLEPWREAARELLDGPFAEEAMVENIDRHAAFIRDEIRKDSTPYTYATHEEAVAWLRSSIPALRARLEALIEE